MAIPLGFRFSPTNEELISGYLLKKIRGEDLPWNGIIDSDIYGKNAPWQIFGDLSDQEEEKVYIFTRLKRASKNRVARLAGCGTWHESYSEKVFEKQSERVIGLKKLFCFKVKEGTRLTKTDWMMHEFSLFGEQETSDLVLCAIQKKGTETRNGINRSSQNQSRISQEPAAIIGAETPCQETLENGNNTNPMQPEDRTQRGKRMRGDLESDATQASQLPQKRSTPSCIATKSTPKSPSCIATESTPKFPSQSNMLQTELETRPGCPDAPQAREMPQEYSTPRIKTTSAPNFPSQSNTQMIELETRASQPDAAQAREMTPKRSTTESAPKFSSQSNTQKTELETHPDRPLLCDSSFSGFYASYGYLLPFSTSDEERMEWFGDDLWI